MREVLHNVHCACIHAKLASMKKAITGQAGGLARARSLSAKKRSDIAAKASQARWKANAKKRAEALIAKADALLKHAKGGSR